MWLTFNEEFVDGNYMVEESRTEIIKSRSLWWPALWKLSEN